MIFEFLELHPMGLLMIKGNSVILFSRSYRPPGAADLCLIITVPHNHLTGTVPAAVARLSHKKYISRLSNNFSESK